MLVTRIAPRAAQHIKPPLLDNVKTVFNEKGIIGGVKVWHKKIAQYFTETLNIVHE
jgi:hypothetical protein